MEKTAFEWILNINLRFLTNDRRVQVHSVKTVSQSESGGSMAAKLN